MVRRRQKPREVSINLSFSSSLYRRTMSRVLLCIKQSLNCCNNQKSTDVLDESDKTRIRRTNPDSGCLRSSSNLRNLDRGERFSQNLSSGSSSRSLESSRFQNMIRLDDSFDYSNRYEYYSLGDRSSDDNTPEICDFGALACRKCPEKVKSLDFFEAHHISKHSVTELGAEEFSRIVVELICNRGSKSRVNISTILKVHNLQTTIAGFENYRETLIIRSNKLPKKHPRCLADGNEFLGFHATTLTCSLGLNGSSDLCFSNHCGVCRILRHGFSPETRSDGVSGVFMASTSCSALEHIIKSNVAEGGVKALVLCRVIAGRVHRPIKRHEQSLELSEFDSVAVKRGSNSSVDELYLLSAKALLPCFVIVLKH